jgi:hypothetical protein
MRFSRGEAVLVNQSAEAISALDAVSSRGGHEPERWRIRVGRRQVERSMWSVAVVMVDEHAEHPLEMAAVDDQQPVEALDADRADEALGDRVHERRRLRSISVLSGKSFA